MRLAVSGGDPTTCIRDGALWRSTYTVQGPATVCVHLSDDSRRVTAWGPGADLIVGSVPGLLGDRDRIEQIASDHEAVSEACRRHWRTPLVRSDDPYHELLPAVLGQRITAGDAAMQWVRLCRRLGAPAPGPDVGMFLPPSPERLASTAYHELHAFGIERRRAETLTAIARRARHLVLGSAGAVVTATADLTTIRGVGSWTAATAGGVAFGDTDAVPVGDYHLKNTVAFALAGRPRGTDEEMLALLKPYRGQRGRVLWWLFLDGWKAPRRGPGRRNLSVANL